MLDIGNLRPLAIDHAKDVEVAAEASHGEQVAVGGKGEAPHLQAQ